MYICTVHIRIYSNISTYTYIYNNTCVHILYIHIGTLCSLPFSHSCDSFVTKMNSSSALQPKQVIWLARPQIKLVWFNFRFGPLLQPYIKGDIFHYTAKPESQQPAVVHSSIGRDHRSMMAFIWCFCRFTQAYGSVSATCGLFIDKETFTHCTIGQCWAGSPYCHFVRLYRVKKSAAWWSCG